MNNSIFVIKPYKWNGMWVFDDERVGLDKEPFVAGADTMIDTAVQLKGLQDAEDGFLTVLSAGPFPHADFDLEWVREDSGGSVGWWAGARRSYKDSGIGRLFGRSSALGQVDQRSRSQSINSSAILSQRESSSAAMASIPESFRYGSMACHSGSSRRKTASGRQRGLGYAHSRVPADRCAIESRFGSSWSMLCVRIEPP